MEKKEEYIPYYIHICGAVGNVNRLFSWGESGGYFFKTERAAAATQQRREKVDKYRVFFQASIKARANGGP
jgi:hypothetical protein